MEGLVDILSFYLEINTITTPLYSFIHLVFIKNQLTQTPCLLSILVRVTQQDDMN
jgi:hypothetical protein